MLNVQSGTCLRIGGHVGGQTLHQKEEPSLLVNRGEEIRIYPKFYRSGETF